MSVARVVHRMPYTSVCIYLNDIGAGPYEEFKEKIPVCHSLLAKFLCTCLQVFSGLPDTGAMFYSEI